MGAPAQVFSRRLPTGVQIVLLVVLSSGCANRVPSAWHSGSVPVEEWAFGQKADVPVRWASPEAQPAAFLDARAIAADARGRIHVSDAGRHAILYADPRPDHRLEWRILGGPGSGRGQFLAPGGLDVDTGSILGVADTGNGRIQRFSRNGALMEIIPMEPHMPPEVRRVQSLADGGLFILIGTEPWLFRMDRIRDRVDPVYLHGRERPADMARFEAGLVVLDTSGGLHVLNHSGVTIRRIPGTPFTFLAPAAIGLLGGTENALWVLNAQLEPEEQWQLPDSIQIRGAAFVGSELHVISRTHLHRLP